MIGILSDAHGHLGAFNRAIELLQHFGVSRFIFLGDALGYIPSIEVVRALKLLGSDVICIMGNHEKMLLGDTLEMHREEVYQLAKVRDKLNKNDLDFMRDWPTHYAESIGGKSVLFVHGSPDDFTEGYVYPDSELSFVKVDYDFVFMGHTHRPFIRRQENVVYVNVGSCGLPRDDGRYGSVAIFSPSSAEVRVLRFDIVTATERLFASNIFCHKSVRDLYLRRTDSLFGELIN